MSGTVAPPRQKFHADFVFTKAKEEESGDLVLVGYASTWGIDRDNERVDPRAFDDSLEKYLAKNPIVLYQHNPEWPIGNVISGEVDAYGLRVKALIPRPADGEAEWAHTAYQKIKAGILKTFSIGGYMDREVKGGEWVITRVELFEISVVAVPANPDSIFEAAVKALKDLDTEARVLTETARRQMAQLTGAEPITDPDLITLDAEDRRRRYDELTALYEEAGQEPPEWGWVDAAAAMAQDDPVAALNVVVENLKRVGGATVLKAGRVLSKSNETKLRDAHEAIGQVLAQVEQQPEVPEDAEA